MVIQGSSADPETGEVQADPRTDRGLARAERYALKAVANRLLPASRTAKCLRWRLPKDNARVLREEQGRAFYAGLQVCASVWACPCCAAKISERRRVELRAAIDVATGYGFAVHLATFTVPHGLGDDVTAILRGMRLAFRKLSTSRRGQDIRAGLRQHGTIRTLEVTHGANGWHPHYHVLVVTDGDVTAEQVAQVYAPLWQRACVAVGLPRPSDQHGCVVQGGEYAAAYASKWGLESEMTKGHTKRGKLGSRTPWDLLRSVLVGDEHAGRSAALFRVYAEAFKGQRQLYWSNGLRELLRCREERTDEEIAREHEASAVVLSILSPEQWRAVLFCRAEADVLSVAEKAPESLPVLLDSLVSLSINNRWGAS